MKTFYLMLVMGVLLLSLSHQPLFGGGAQEEAKPEATEQKEKGLPPPPDKLYIFSESGSLGKTLGAGVQMWNEKYDKPKLEHIMVPTDQASKKQMLELSAGIGAEIQSVNVSILLQTEKFLEPLNSFLKEDPRTSELLEIYLPKLLRLYQEPFPAREFNLDAGRLVGIPWRGGVYVLAYRKDLLSQAGISPPQTHEQLIDAAKKLTKNGIYGFGVPGKTYGHTEHLYNIILTNMGGQILSADGKSSALDWPVARKALDVVLELTKYAPEEFVTWDQNEQVAAGQTGLVAMEYMFHHRLFRMDDPDKSKTAGKWDAVPVQDGGEAIWSGHALCIRKGIEHKRWAWEIVKFLTSPETQRTMILEFANSSPVARAYDDPAVIEKYTYVPAIKEALAKGYFPIHPKRRMIVDIIAEELNSLFVKKQTPDQALSNMHKRLNELLK